jgi:hypothetical protein
VQAAIEPMAGSVARVTRGIAARLRDSGSRPQLQSGYDGDDAEPGSLAQSACGHYACRRQAARLSGQAVAVKRPLLRPIIIPASLEELHGPSAGVVEVPSRLYWSAGSRRFDVSDADQAAALYDAVLDAASSPGDLTEYINPGLLVTAWPVLGMSRAKRDAWEARFPVLRRQRLAAAA